MRPQPQRFASKQIEAPEAVFHVTQKRQPRRTVGARCGSGMESKNPANHILINSSPESQVDLLGDTRTSPCWIALLHLDDCPDQIRSEERRVGKECRSR